MEAGNIGAQDAGTRSIGLGIELPFEQAMNPHIDVPVEWLDTVGYALAQRLITTFGVKAERAARIDAIADRLLAEAMDYDREPLVTMRPERRDG
jgi:predicted Rossmann-fold nucleotide-binding protein